MFYRFILIMLFIIGAYSLVGIGNFKWMYHKIDNPKADFLVMGNTTSDITVVEFLNYGCAGCKEINPVIKELIEIRPDIRYVVRPVVAVEDEVITRITNIVFAAGLQGKFLEMHDAILEYPEAEVPDSFIEETANLFGLNYTQLLEDAKSEKVQKITDHNYSTFEHAGIYTVPSFVINGKIYSASNEALPTLKELLSLITAAQ